MYSGLMVSLAFPMFLVTMFLIYNFAHWIDNSEAAINIGKIIIFVLMYFMLSTANVWLGSLIGFKKSTIKNPGKINKLSRDIPMQPWYLRMKMLIPLGGILPFS